MDPSDDLKRNRQPKPAVFIIIFIGLATVEIAGVFFNFHTLQLIAKPLLMPVLILYLYYSLFEVKTLWLIYSALIFSFLGDVFLLFDGQQPDFFLYGVGAFLTAHIFYIIYFFKIKSGPDSFFRQHPWWLLLIFAYALGLLLLLYPGLGQMKVPVIIYAIVISTMLAGSLHVFYKVPAPSNRYYLIGAVLFVLSDSLLAVNKFYFQFAASGILIMLTYCAAQFLIVHGVARHKIANSAVDGF